MRRREPGIGLGPGVRVVVIGVGSMGLAMAGRLIQQARQVAVRDIQPERERMAEALGARLCASPAAVAAVADRVIICVVDPHQTDSVLFDPHEGAWQNNKPCIVLCATWICSDRLPRAIAGDLAPRAHTSLLDKDVRLALGMAAAAGFDASVGAAAAPLFARACDSAMASLDDACLFAMLRNAKPA